MGYYTGYSLEVFEKDNDEWVNLRSIDLIKLTHIIEDLKDYFSYVKCAFDAIGCENESVKWYDSNENMIAFSIRYPDCLFELTGHGEERGDIWRKYYRNGAVQSVSVEFVFGKYIDPELATKRLITKEL